MSRMAGAQAARVRRVVAAAALFLVAGVTAHAEELIVRAGETHVRVSGGQPGGGNPR